VRRQLLRLRLKLASRIAFYVAVAAPFVLLTSGGLSDQTAIHLPSVSANADVDAARRFGAASPSERDWLSVIASDVWIHPLDGPARRMPISDSRVFGAERPGERPAECRNGHCGVDIGGEVFGEPVHAVHDGVIDRVQRGPNEDHGGLYVRIAHRDGTVFSQYFHLAAIPRRIHPGLAVKAGEVIGLVGESGVKHSTAHLHFTLSVKPASNMKEQYIDPEALIAIWPLRLPVTATAGVLVASAAPGVPRGAASRSYAKRRRQQHAQSSRAVELPRLAPPPSDEASAD
jgi:murein DD-endopeptidase MepM/ murein hydrolase activator NlpD